MQNVVNFRTPFLFEGKPIVDGRVYFVKEDTSALTFDSVAGLDSAFFITIKDKDGTTLQNPLPLDSHGRFSVQPFVDDDINFKMIVFRPTGIPAELHDESMAWELVDVMVNKAPDDGGGFEGLARVPGLSALRALDPYAGSALVLGYSSAYDFCPPRIFTWREAELEDNGGTHIRSNVEGFQNSGVWVCEPEYYVDVRWFGVSPLESGAVTDSWTTVNNIVTAYYPELPIYFPGSGYYWLSDDITVGSTLVLDKGAKIRCIGKNITVTINRLENRGGQFQRSQIPGDPYYFVYPKVKGEFHSSWVNAPKNQITLDMLRDVDYLVFDSDTDFDTDHTIRQKRVLIKSGVSVSGVTFDDCEVFRESGSVLEVNEVVLAGIAKILANNTSNVKKIYLKLNNGSSYVNVLQIIDGTIKRAILDADLAIPFLHITPDEDGFREGWNLDDGSIFEEGQKALYAHRLYAALLKANHVETSSLDLTYMSHAKSSRKKISISLLDSDTISVNVPDVGSCNIIKDNGFFKLDDFEVIIEGMSVHKNIFEGARDFDVCVDFLTIPNTNLKLILPACSGLERIVAFYAHCKAYVSVAGSTGFASNGLTLCRDSSHEISLAQDSTVDSASPFTGKRIVRKRSDGAWFFDPFAI